MNTPTPRPGTAHTPGPWSADQSAAEILGADGTFIGMVLASSHSFQTLYLDPAKAKFCHIPEAEANARLIATSPALLSALEKARRYVGYCYRTGVEDFSNDAEAMLVEIDAAIASARHD